MADFSNPSPVYEQPQPVTTSSYVPPSPTPVQPPVTPPVIPTYVPKPQSSLGPILIGFFLVLFLAGIIGFIYFQAKFATNSPVPSPTATPMQSPSPSIEPSEVPSATPKATKKPVSVITPSPTPKPTLIARPTLDIRFGNPSVNVKQTLDEGAGDGRVINREFTSIQSGQFDEVKSVWSPRVTVCYHMVANEEISSGKDVKFTFTLDDKVETEGDLGQYDKLEAGRLYDWCRDVTTNIGKHTTRMLLNPSKTIKEDNYTNDLARLEWENLKDSIAPNFTLIGPKNEGVSGSCLLPQYVSDNVSLYSELKIEQKVDSVDWAPFSGSRYCFVGIKGSSHKYTIKITDLRGNVNEQSRTFVLY